MPCQTHSPFFLCIQSPATCWLCSSCIAPSLPEHRAPGKQQHGGVNISVTLKHHLLKDLPHLLWQWPRPWDRAISIISVISIISALGAANTHIQTKHEAPSAPLLWSEVFIPSFTLAHKHYRTLWGPLWDCTPRIWAHQTHWIHNTFDTHVLILYL